MTNETHTQLDNECEAARKLLAAGNAIAEGQRKAAKFKELIAKADAMRRKAGCNAAYNPKHSARVKAMMIGRADALESKAYSL